MRGKEINTVNCILIN